VAPGEILPEWSPARVIARLEARREGLETGRSALIAFDGDGTLWSGDIGDELFEGLLARRGIRPEAHAELEAEARRFEVVALTPDPHDVAAALFAAYRAGRYPEDRVFAMMAWAMAGHTEEEAAALAAAVLEERPVDGRIHEGVAPLLAWAEDRGVEAWIVSASPRPAVLAAAAAIGVSPSRVIAMTPAIEGGRLAPRIAGGFV
jgi:phosphatidylglycerophosphatase C